MAGMYRIDTDRLLAKIERCQRRLKQSEQLLDGGYGLLSDTEHRLLRRGGEQLHPIELDAQRDWDSADERGGVTQAARGTHGADIP